MPSMGPIRQAPNSKSRCRGNNASDPKKMPVPTGIGKTNDCRPSPERACPFGWSLSLGGGACPLGACPLGVEPVPWGATRKRLSLDRGPSKNPDLRSCAGPGSASPTHPISLVNELVKKRPPSCKRGPETKPGRQSEDDRTPRGIIRISSVGLSGDSEALNNDTSENERRCHSM